MANRKMIRGCANSDRRWGRLRSHPIRLKSSQKQENTHINFVKLAKVHGVEAVDGRSDVLAVGALLHHLQLPHAGDVGQPGLDLRHVRHLRRCVWGTSTSTKFTLNHRRLALLRDDLYLDFLRPGIEPFPQQPPARQAVAVVTEVGLVLAAHVDGDHRPGAHVPGYVGWQTC